jgi:hypothetical protein
VGEEIKIEIEKNSQIPEKISQILEREIAEGNFVRIIIENKIENRLVLLKEILEGYQVWAPESVFEKIEDFTLAIYSQKEGKRIVLVAKVKEGEKLDELKDWEGKIEKEGVFLSGEKIPTISNKFKETLIGGERVRFLTVSKNDLGICYSQINNYFIFSESLNGMGKVIEKIKK